MCETPFKTTSLLASAPYKTALIDKRGAIGNFYLVECQCFSLLEHWFESDITTGLLRNQTTQFQLELLM
jgi:hypothetical protein